MRFSYLIRIHTVTFLPFRTYNTDNQLIIDTIIGMVICIMNQKLSYMKTMFYSIKIKLLLLHTEQKKQTIQFQIVSQQLESMLLVVATLSPA